MIKSFCELLKKQINEDIAGRREALEKGAGGFPQDERLRGEIWGLRVALDHVHELEERARKSDNE